MNAAQGPIGPILIVDDIREGRVCLAALIVMTSGELPTPLDTPEGPVQPERLARYREVDVFRARFSVPADRPSDYRWRGESFDLAGLGPDMRIAYVSCNGEEHGDLDRPNEERNVMWSRLAQDHETFPFSLLLHGGDQVYADEVTHGHPMSEDWPDRIPRDPSRADLGNLRTHLRERFMERYLAVYRCPGMAHVMARVPSLMQWDDHDICDGWGSLRRSRTYSPVGQTLFDTAREAALLFQHGTVDGDLPGRFADPLGLHLGWSVAALGLRILGPDLRSERSRREVMGARGWTWIEAESRKAAPGRTLVMSSVPLLGPRLSLLELLMVLMPSMQKYEDDLRDQWQSRAHRGSWIQMLETMARIAAPEGQDVTVLSGEIHLATRGEMALPNGKPMHQLVASGIAHRAPPKAWARALGALAWMGESPLPGHKVRILPIPGQPRRYVAERNYLTVETSGQDWSARWVFEESGRSPALAL
ncbi:alkaline phosphatase D family protein [Lutimaribacter marinistellae]|uniref:Alkaline phosphatase D family protein n=1 Tax=Lutimaribacter marinistellae TaxID=1820329 RepID=A0ABV7THI1_9RHOB